MPKPVYIPPVFFHSSIKGFSLSNRTDLKRFIARLCKQEHHKLQELHYIFCSDKLLLNINRQYLQHDFYTDIISFDLSDIKNEINGEIHISIDRVRENALTYKTSFKQELHRVLFHGALHLCGYRDKSKPDQQKMRALEDKYLYLYFK